MSEVCCCVGAAALPRAHVLFFAPTTLCRPLGTHYIFILSKCTQYYIIITINVHVIYTVIVIMPAVYVILYYARGTFAAVLQCVHNTT